MISFDGPAKKLIMKHYFLLALLVCLQWCFGSSLYFVIKKGEPRCFFLEYPKQTPLRVTYEYPSKDSSQGDVRVRLEAASKVQFSGYTLEEKEGEFSLEMEDNEEASLCFESDSAQAQRVGARVAVGRPQGAFARGREVREHLTLFQAELAKVGDELVQVLNEADFMKEHEVIFHSESERMNSAAMWWPILQISILVVTGVMVVNNLKRFFKSKKLV
uniref:GOLD domain-containing protein n=1 Tax=Heterosigma akashiwo TaxID=2829 RepID=A0A6S9HJ16_HETAK|mmetsp:Transcript_6445/g.9550  ORF Transcript_6445/g.9550 Transcript_6445/m.9550 type:complete len:217 (+) Transcript_6445:35-685(+)